MDVETSSFHARPQSHHASYDEDADLSDSGGTDVVMMKDIPSTQTTRLEFDVAKNAVPLVVDLTEDDVVDDEFNIVRINIH